MNEKLEKSIEVFIEETTKTIKTLSDVVIEMRKDLDCVMENIGCIK